jgi:hypothetical protein
MRPEQMGLLVALEATFPVYAREIVLGLRFGSGEPDEAGGLRRLGKTHWSNPLGLEA